MRTTTKRLLVLASLTLGIALPAYSQAAATDVGGSVTCVLHATVSSFVRLVPTPADQGTGGVAGMTVVTNDPRLRVAFRAPVSPEVIGPEAISFQTRASSGGGESSLKGELVAGPTTVRYTVTTP
jgi:hypothetical protein